MTFHPQPAQESAPQPEISTMHPRELTLIVAATNKMGIGINNSLPWKGLKKEMAYFARITKRAPAGVRLPYPLIHSHNSQTNN
jgi:hypothetical protein